MGHIAGKHQARAVASCKGTPQLRAYCKVCLTGSAGTDLGSCRVSFQLLASVYVWQAPQDRLPSKMHQQRFVMKSLPQSWSSSPGVSPWQSRVLLQAEAGQEHFTWAPHLQELS